MKKFNLTFLFVLAFFYSINSYSETLLYPDEQLIEVNKVQVLSKFILGDLDKPLIIFLTGDAQLARISYGLPTGKEDDFLSYWLHKKGYPFLGISYPTDNSVYSKIYPSFSIRDWGSQVATLAKTIVDQNHLSSHVVVLGFGMAGVIEQSVQEAMNKVHLTLDEFIGLSAVPPLLVSPSYGGANAPKILSNNLVDEKSVGDYFSKLLVAQSDYNGHEIIPLKTYKSEFFGNTPVALKAEGYFFKNNKFIFQAEGLLNDTGVFRYDSTPWIGLIFDDSSTYSKINLVDSSGWNFIRNEMIYWQFMYYTNIESNINKFSITKRILMQIPQHFSDTVHGNHLFFVGKKGARDTAQKVEILMQRINTTKQNLVKLALD